MPVRLVVNPARLEIVTMRPRRARFMRGALEKVAKHDFPFPNGDVVKVARCGSGKLGAEYYLAGTEPLSSCGTSAKKIDINAYQPPAPMTPSHHYQFGNVAFKCPYCQSQSPPIQQQKISTAGWVLFVVLLLACFPLCWIGLLIKEDYLSCSFCGLNLG